MFYGDVQTNICIPGPSREHKEIAGAKTEVNANLILPSDILAEMYLQGPDACILLCPYEASGKFSLVIFALEKVFPRDSLGDPFCSCKAF